MALDDDVEFPEELDLALQQKFFIVRFLIEQYRDGMIDVKNGLTARATLYREKASLTDPVQLAVAEGYTIAAADVQKNLDAMDWEELILDAQSKVLQQHGNDEDDDEGE